MKLVVQTQLLPDPDQDRKLRAVVGQFNAAANFAAGVAFADRTANVYEVRKLAYAEIRERFGLSSQMAQLAIKAACDAYRRDKSIRPVFRPDAAIVYDQRVMSFKGIDRVSLLTLEGRVVVPFVFGKYSDERFKLPKGQSDLILREDGKWILLVTVDVPDGTEFPVPDFLGVDMGIANIAADSDPESEPSSGETVEDVRRKHNLQRRRLQRKGTKGAKKKLRRISKKEARFRRHENHCISQKIVETAKRIGRGIALEDLKGIRERVTARGSDARNRLSGWSFGQLYAFLAYKAQLAGVPVETVDPRNTSRTCAACGHCRKSNRKSQAEFVCKACGHRAHADKNAARNIRARALAKRALELDDPRVEPEIPSLRADHYPQLFGDFCPD
jgi:IS605 OrfB family transposase